MYGRHQGGSVLRDLSPLRWVRFARSFPLQTDRRAAPRVGQGPQFRVNIRDQHPGPRYKTVPRVAAPGGHARRGLFYNEAIEWLLQPAKRTQDIAAATPEPLASKKPANFKGFSVGQNPAA